MTTNFFRIELPFADFQIQRLPYTEDSFRGLKEKHNTEASFFYNDSYIYISPSKGSGLKLGEHVTLKTEDNPAITSSLIRHLIFRKFHEEFPDRIPESFSPLRFFSTQQEHDPLQALLPPELKGVVCFPRMVEVETRFVLENTKPSFGVLIRIRNRWQLNVTLNEMRNEGFNVIGKSVLEKHAIPNLHGVLSPTEELLGEIEELDGDTAKIITNNGVIQRDLNQLSLQRTSNQIGEYLEFRLGATQASQVLRGVRDFQREQENQNVTFTEIKKIVTWFRGRHVTPRRYENDDGFNFTVTENNEFERASFSISRTSLLFDYDPSASATHPSKGLNQYGPFNSERFACNDLRILVICQSRSRGAITQFLKQLIDGIPDNRYFDKGLVGLFRLRSVSPTIKEVSSITPEAYEAAVDEAVKSSERRFDIAIIECPDNSERIKPQLNCYYRSKVRLMSYGIPVQGVQSNKLRSNSSSLGFILGPMALQIYAKTGGTPWRLPTSPSVDREIVIGIGSSLERPNLWSGAEQSRIVGITTFFRGDGSYILGEKMRSVPYADYFGTLLDSLKSSIDVVAKENAWNNGDTVRVVFHIFKPLKNIEADVIEELVKSFPQYNISFAFVTISSHHPWMMFARSYTSGGKTEIVLCNRGDVLTLDDHHCLLQIRGDRDRANRSQRPPLPVSIRVHEKSTFNDLQYIVQQIHDFSYLSWRSFFPCHEPVTLFYSNLIARQTHKLSKVSGWQVGYIDSHFRRKLWFL